MADDVAYQREAHQILGEFAQADWEALPQDPRPDAGNRQS